VEKDPKSDFFSIEDGSKVYNFLEVVVYCRIV